MFNKLFFKTMDDACNVEIFSVEVTDRGKHKVFPARKLTQLQSDTVYECFKFFNEFNCESAYALDLDGGINDGISRCGIHHDIASE